MALDVGPYLGLLAILGFILVNNNRIHENARSVVELNYHNHGADGRSLPTNIDGELIHTLDGVRGWY